MSAPYDPARWRRERWNTPGTIYFWSGHSGDHHALSNFAATPFVMTAWHPELGVVPFPTGEHAFQAAKAPTPLEHEQIRLARTPLAAKRAGRAVALPADWDQRRTRVMLSVIRAKFASGPPRELLLSTGDLLLAEDSPYDPLWGCRDPAGGYQGSNLLGRALMRVRDELRENHPTLEARADRTANTPGRRPLRTCICCCQDVPESRYDRDASACTGCVAEADLHAAIEDHDELPARTPG